jgi:hypothetical protein
MQEGRVIREHRKLGPDVWSYRWWESGPNGNRVHRRIVLRTAEQLRDLSSARRMTTGLMGEINASDIRLAGTSIIGRNLFRLWRAHCAPTGRNWWLWNARLRVAEALVFRRHHFEHALNRP